MMDDLSERDSELGRLRRQVAQTEQLAATLSEVGAAPTLERALEQLVRGAIRLLGADHGVARVTDPQTRLPIYVVIVGQDGILRPDTNPTPSPPGTFSYQIMRGSGPLVVEDFLALDPETFPLYHNMKARGLRSAVHVPIEADMVVDDGAGGRVTRRSLIGSLSVESRAPGAFGAHEAAVAGALAAQAGGAIARAWLADEVDRLKTEFVSLVSHELRTPLTSITGYTDLLLTGEVGEIGEEQREFLEIVKNNADRLVTLINDLLDVSRIEAGKVDLDRHPVDVGSIVREVANALRPQIEGKAQRLTLEVAANVPRVNGDRNRLTQVFTNLLSNAHKYMPREGGVSMRVLAAEGGEQVVVEVRDTGIGMTPEDLSQLYQKFFRAKNRTTQEVGGTGLGLAITKQLVELHGGRISVQSVVGQGTTFRVSLPAEAAQAELTEQSSQTNQNLSQPAAAPRVPKLVLVVDDEPDVAALLRRYLERGGYRVLTAATGAEAVHSAREAIPDLITLDINLPDADGIAVLERLKADVRTARIPVVLLSVQADTGRGRRLGAADYLYKPIDPVTLLARVGTLLTPEQVVNAIGEALA